MAPAFFLGLTSTPVCGSMGLRRLNDVFCNDIGTEGRLFGDGYFPWSHAMEGQSEHEMCRLVNHHGDRVRHASMADMREQ